MRWMSWVVVSTTLLAGGGSHFSTADNRAMEGRPALSLTYVANAGVLVAVGNAKSCSTPSSIGPTRRTARRPLTRSSRW